MKTIVTNSSEKFYYVDDNEHTMNLFNILTMSKDMLYL